MASNAIERPYPQLIQLAENAADGAQTHGPAVGVAQNTTAKIRTDLKAVIGDPSAAPPLPGLKALQNAAEAAKVAATALKQSAQSNGRALAGHVVTALSPRLGKEWSSAWNAVGFTQGNLSIPRNPLALLQQMSAYFTAHPTHEVPDLIPGLVPPIAVTAASCNAAALAISDAVSASNTSNTDMTQARLAFRAGLKALRQRLSALLAELEGLLADDDPRWYAFGFERPADPETPEEVENVVVSSGAPGSGELFVDCDDARRADSYRFTVRVPGTGTVLATRLVEESEALFTGLPPGTAVEVIATALNEAGESAPSEPVAGTVG